MKIPHDIINLNSSYIGHFADEAILLLIIANLHHNKKISNEKFKGMMSSLRSGTLNRRVNTFHCTINDKWYSDENMVDILTDVYNKVCPITDLSLNDFLGYINICYSRNKNYCINWVYFQLINPLILALPNNQAVYILRKFGVIPTETYKTYEELDMHGELSFGYCCEDCDGDIYEYKQNKYNFYYLHNMKTMMENAFKKYLLSQKTHQKNTNEMLK